MRVTCVALSGFSRPSTISRALMTQETCEASLMTDVSSISMFTLAAQAVSIVTRHAPQNLLFQITNIGIASTDRGVRKTVAVLQCCIHRIKSGSPDS